MFSANVEQRCRRVKFSSSGGFLSQLRLTGMGAVDHGGESNPSGARPRRDFLKAWGNWSKPIAVSCSDGLVRGKGSSRAHNDMDRPMRNDGSLARLVGCSQSSRNWTMFAPQDAEWLRQSKNRGGRVRHQLSVQKGSRPDEVESSFV
jgi:hypothetical protein